MDGQQQTPTTKPGFWRGVFSDSGEPSSSRVLTVVLSIGSLGIIVAIVVHLIHLHDPAQLSLWLTSLPGIILGMVGMSSAPYTVNRASGSISDIFNSLRNK
jgi:hypothetical protein